MMNELKPEDVMKALECWASHKPCDEDCPVLEYEGSQNCLAITIENALALLREKDAEIKGLVDGWSKDQDRFEQVCAEKDAEIERLNKERDDARWDCAVAEQNHYECKKELETARAEAITEFAELWKKWWYGQIQVAVNEYQESIIYDAIDQIAKEMRGETDEN